MAEYGYDCYRPVKRAVSHKSRQIPNTVQAMLRENPSFKHIRVGINPPREGKDYNEKLMSKLQLLQNLPQRRREKRAAISI